MEGYTGLVSRLIRCLNDSSLDYAFTGALAVSYYGAPRTTSDVDLLVAVSRLRVDKAKILETLRCAGLKADDPQIDKALTSGFNIASFEDESSPYSVDVIFSTDRFEKRPGSVAGLSTFLQLPEDLIAAKLRMIRATLSSEAAMKDMGDIKSILLFTTVDLEAVRVKAVRDGTLDILDDLLQ